MAPSHRTKSPIKLWGLLVVFLLGLGGLEMLKATFGNKVTVFSQLFKPDLLVELFVLFFLSPVLGSLLDGHASKKPLLMGSLLVSLATLLLGLFLALDLQAELSKIYERPIDWKNAPSLPPVSLFRDLLFFLVRLVFSCASLVFWCSFITTATLLAPFDQLLTYSGFTQSIQALSALISLRATGLGMMELLPSLHVNSVMLVAVLMLISSLVFCHRLVFPEYEISASPLRKVEWAWFSLSKNFRSLCTLWREGLAAWEYVKSLPGLLFLFAIFALSAFGSFLAFLTLGSQISNATSFWFTSLLAGHVFLVFFGWGLDRQVKLVILAFGLDGVILLVAFFMGGREDLQLYAVGLFIFLTPIPRGFREACFQRKSPWEIHGRAFALQRATTQCLLPLACAFIGNEQSHACIPWTIFDFGLHELITQMIYYDGESSGHRIDPSLKFFHAALLIAGVINVAISLTAYFFMPFRTFGQTVSDFTLPYPQKQLLT